MAHFLLCCTTWTASRTDKDMHPLAHALGTIWDETNISRHLLRPMANSWVQFSGKHIAKLFKAWGDAPASDRL